MSAGVISLFPVVIYNEICNSHVSAALSAQDFARQHARSAPLEPRTFEQVIDPSRAALRRRGERRVLLRLCRGQTNRGGRIQRRSSRDRLVPFNSHPRILVTKVAPPGGMPSRSLLRGLRGRSFASWPGIWLRLSRPTQSLMTRARHDSDSRQRRDPPRPMA